ncbi:hypothetical protein F4859DRAFT_293643 [Xylaria cf. heliscus]|nr:hypothetical protein F4859DRAFT_293643 [Xylaria cf. heliscus]
MPRPPSNVDDFRDEAIALYETGASVPSIYQTIVEKGCKCSQRTLERRIQTWGIGGTRAGRIRSHRVLSRIQFLFYYRGLDDQAIKADLASAGVSLSIRAIKHIRARNGMKRRYRTDEERNQTVQRASEWLEQHLESSTQVRGFGNAQAQAGNAEENLG